jgi:AcrR family transcriptional regulator
VTRKRVVSKTARSPGRPRSAVAHKAILNAALTLLGESGYDALTIEGVAARAGVGKKTVYRRWPSKEAMVAEALARSVGDIRVPDTGSTEDDLLAVMRESVRVYQQRTNVEFVPGLVSAIARSEHIARTVRSGFLAARRAALRQIFERAVARGDLRPDMDRELALDILGGPLIYRMLFTGGALDDELASRIVDVIVRGFGR